MENKAEKKYIEIMRNKSGEERVKLSCKINNKIFETAKKKIKSRYQKFDIVSFSKELYKHLAFKREFYDNLFNKFLKRELKNN